MEIRQMSGHLQSEHRYGEHHTDPKPAGHIGNTKDVVDAVLYLTDAQFTTGIVVPVDGGASAGKW